MIEYLPDGRIREGNSTYSSSHPVYQCQSGKSPDCTKETRGTYFDGTFGYKGAVDTDPEKKMIYSQTHPEYRCVAMCHPCFTWEFWLDIERQDKLEYEKNKVVIVNGHHYGIGQEQPNDYNGFKGFGGAKFIIHFFDGRKVISTNLWTQGKIPEAFLERFPDNAEFIHE